MMENNSVKSLLVCGRLLKAVGVSFGIAAFGAGCMTYPLIEESLAVIESEPLSAKFAPPAHELVEEEDLGAEGLLGTWATSYESHSRITGKGLPDDHPSKQNSLPISESYTFLPDGTYAHRVNCKWSYAYSWSYFGKWTYADGTLKLLQERSTFESDAMMVPNKEWRTTASRAYKVDWYEDGQIILKDESLPPTAIGRRVIVSVDPHGVRTERTFYIQGSENGRERGWIDERTSLVRFKKTSTNN